MEQPAFRYIYGPVYSWRLGMSLGIDPIATGQKTCNFDCVYCQLGSTVVQTRERRVFVSTQDVMHEIALLGHERAIDYLTFSGSGEPTLALNLGEMISSLRATRSEKIAVITNAGLMDVPEVRADLLLADCVVAKLDAASAQVWNTVDRPHSGDHFAQILDGLKEFSRQFSGRLAVQMMFVQANKDSAAEMARVAASIGAAEIELNTPLRPCGVKPLSLAEMMIVKKHFEGIPGVTMVYDHERITAQAIDERATMKRHGDYLSSGD